MERHGLLLEGKRGVVAFRRILSDAAQTSRDQEEMVVADPDLDQIREICNVGGSSGTGGAGT